MMGIKFLAWFSELPGINEYLKIHTSVFSIIPGGEQWAARPGMTGRLSEMPAAPCGNRPSFRAHISREKSALKTAGSSSLLLDAKIQESCSPALPCWWPGLRER